MAEQACAGAGPAHAVPLVAQASGIEGQRVARVTFFLGGAVGFGDQLRASRGGREAAVCIEPCGALLRASGKWPLLRPQAVEQCVAEAGKIEVAAGGKQLVFVEQAAAVGKGEQAGFSGTQVPFQAAREVADDVPVLARFTGGRNGPTDMTDPPFRIGHGAFLFSPGCGWKQKVGVLAGFRAGEGFLDHHEGTAGKGLVDLALVRQRLRGVGTGDPERLDPAVVDRIEQLDGAETGGRGQLFHTPVVRHLGAMAGIGGFAVAGQQVGQAAGLATAHGVRLAGEGKRPASGAADLAGSQVQVDQRAVLGAAGAGLVEPHAPERKEARRTADPFGAALQVGQLAGVGAPRVDHHDAHLRPSGLGGFQATEQDRVGEGHVAAGDQHAIGAVEVFVAARRCVGAQAALVADHRRGHAQARIAVDVVGADQGPRQLVEGVVVLGQQLAGDIEGHAVRPMFANGLGETPGGMFQGTLPVAASPRQLLAEAQLGVQRAGLEVAGQVQAGAFAAESAEVGRVPRIALHAEDAFAVVFDQDATTHAAVAAGRSGGAQRGICRHARLLLSARDQAHSATLSRPSSTRPFSTRTGWRWAQPWSGATASPLSSSICQLCNGQATRLP
ncbi:Uncharacterised protein [Pseudomonas aeruginosa]|nr:Uncharacterised protein [Pseudomonas aeruginosa]